MKLSIEITPNELVELIEMFYDDCDCDCDYNDCDCEDCDCEDCDCNDDLVNLLANTIAEMIEELGDE